MGGSSLKGGGAASQRKDEEEAQQPTGNEGARITQGRNEEQSQKSFVHNQRESIGGERSHTQGGDSSRPSGFLSMPSAPSAHQASLWSYYNVMCETKSAAKNQLWSTLVPWSSHWWSLITMAPLLIDVHCVELTLADASFSVTPLSVLGQTKAAKRMSVSQLSWEIRFLTSWSFWLISCNPCCAFTNCSWLSVRQCVTVSPILNNFFFKDFAPVTIPRSSAQIYKLGCLC